MPDPTATYTSDDIVAAIKIGLGAEPLVHCQRGMVTEVCLCSSCSGAPVRYASVDSSSDVTFVDSSKLRLVLLACLSCPCVSSRRTATHVAQG